MQTGFTKNPSDPMGKKSGRKMEFSAIFVGRVGTWVAIQNALLRVRPACRKCKGKDNFASVCKTKSKNRGVNQVQEELEGNGEQVDCAFRVTNEVH